MQQSRFFRFVDTKLSNAANMRLCQGFSLMAPIVVAGLLPALTFFNKGGMLKDVWFYVCSALLATLAALAAYIKHLTGEKEKRDQKAQQDTHEQEILRLQQEAQAASVLSAEDFLKNWQQASDYLSGALTRTRRSFEHDQDPQMQYSMLSELDAYFLTIIRIAEILYDEVGRLQVTLAVPNSKRTALRVTHVTPERSEPNSGQAIPIKGDEVPGWGAAQAYLTRQAYYATNVEDFGVTGRPYRSVLSVPVLDSQQNVLCVVNVHSDQVSPFGQERSKGVQAFVGLIDPVIKGISINAFVRGMVN